VTSTASNRRFSVEAVLFDYGLTLVHFERPVRAIEEAQREVARCITEAGHPAPSAALLQVAVHDRVEAEVVAHERSGALEEIDVGALETRAFADVGLQLDPRLRDRCSALVQEAWWAGVALYAETVEVLRALRGGGLRLGICSNAPYRPASMHDQLAHLGLDGLVDAAVFSAEVGWRKPSPRVFTAALDAVGASAARTVFVGDREREDVAGAAAMGMHTILVRRDGREPRDPAGPDAVIRSLSELPAMVLEDART